jgi:hypothetical protein
VSNIKPEVSKEMFNKKFVIQQLIGIRFSVLFRSFSTRNAAKKLPKSNRLLMLKACFKPGAGCPVNSAGPVA